MKVLYFSFFLATAMADFEPTPSGFYPEDKFRCLFDKYKERYNKSYKNELEEERRYKTFVNNLKDINEKNAKSFKTVQFGINQFTDLSEEEMAAHENGCLIDEQDIPSIPELPDNLWNKTDPSLMSEVDPENFDWRVRNVVTDVKNQKDCGSCWAFSVIGSIESSYAIKYSVLPAKRFSEQQLVDCTPEHGCNGGRLSDALKYIEKGSNGLNYEEDYPYVAKEQQCCSKPKKFRVTVAGFYKLPVGEETLKKVLRKVGPVAAAVNTNQLKKYKGGIWPGDTCQQALTHAVLVVGYGVEKKVPYWIIKNSWGKTWGENGYYRMRRGRGTCLIGAFSVLPRVDKM